MKKAEASKEQMEAVITEYFKKKIQKDPKIHNAYLLVHSEKLGINLNLAEGQVDHVQANPKQPYHIASVSKLFTAVLIGILVEKGMLSYEDPISLYLDLDLLHNLHIHNGKDYSNEIQIKHLLNHTSGLNDYFEDKPKQGKSMIDMIFGEPSRSWTPLESIHWSKKHLKSHFPPGKGFHYSDTGYHLLGFIIEKTASKPLHEAMRNYIFQPLGMNHTYFAQYSRPIVSNDHPVARLYARNIDVTEYTSLSIGGYAGGGIISTNEDLLTFMKALVKHELVSESAFERMKDWAKFFLGIDYGYGLMSFKTIPVFMPKKYNAWGNAGSTGSFMFYHPALDTYIIGSLNQLRYHTKGFRLMFKIMDKLWKTK